MPLYKNSSKLVLRGVRGERGAKTSKEGGPTRRPVVGRDDPPAKASTSCPSSWQPSPKLWRPPSPSSRPVRKSTSESTRRDNLIQALVRASFSFLRMALALSSCSSTSYISSSAETSPFLTRSLSALSCFSCFSQAFCCCARRCRSSVLNVS